MLYQVKTIKSLISLVGRHPPGCRAQQGGGAVGGEPLTHTESTRDASFMPKAQELTEMAAWCRIQYHTPSGQWGCCPGPRSPKSKSRGGHPSKVKIPGEAGSSPLLVSLCRVGKASTYLSCPPNTNVHMPAPCHCPPAPQL